MSDGIVLCLQREPEIWRWMRFVLFLHQSVLLGLGDRVYCHRSCAVVVQVAKFRWPFCHSFCTGVSDVSQREIICLSDVSRMLNTIAYHRKHDECMPNPTLS